MLSKTYISRHFFINQLFSFTKLLLPDTYARGKKIMVVCLSLGGPRISPLKNPDGDGWVVCTPLPVGSITWRNCLVECRLALVVHCSINPDISTLLLCGRVKVPIFSSQ